MTSKILPTLRDVLRYDPRIDTYTHREQDGTSGRYDGASAATAAMLRNISKAERLKNGHKPVRSEQ